MSEVQTRLGDRERELALPPLAGIPGERAVERGRAPAALTAETSVGEPTASPARRAFARPRAVPPPRPSPRAAARAAARDARAPRRSPRGVRRRARAGMRPVARPSAASTLRERPHEHDGLAAAVRPVLDHREPEGPRRLVDAGSPSGGPGDDEGVNVFRARPVRHAVRTIAITVSTASAGPRLPRGSAAARGGRRLRG